VSRARQKRVNTRRKPRERRGNGWEEEMWLGCLSAGARVAVWVALAGLSTPSYAEGALTPKEAGARYGQALGAVEICIGSKVTDKAIALQAGFTGGDLDAFKAQAAKVFEAWLKVKNCARPDDPNQCKIIMDKSCEAAAAEIGEAGSVVPGLVDFPKR
jgi:hypothetical protein